MLALLPSATVRCSRTTPRRPTRVRARSRGGVVVCGVQHGETPSGSTPSASSRKVRAPSRLATPPGECMGSQACVDKRPSHLMTLWRRRLWSTSLWSTSSTYRDAGNKTNQHGKRNVDKHAAVVGAGWRQGWTVINGREEDVHGPLRATTTSGHIPSHLAAQCNATRFMSITTDKTWCVPLDQG